MKRDRLLVAGLVAMVCLALFAWLAPVALAPVAPEFAEVFAPSSAEAEIRYVSISATSTVTNTTLAAGTRSVTIVNDGTNSVYFRLFSSFDTAADATTSSAKLKSGESMSFTFAAGSSGDSSLASGYYKVLSTICAATETATVRVYTK